MPRIVQWERQIGRRLQLRDLFVFATVVKSGSMARAAAELGVSKPSVSEIIAGLEHALGVRLLDRSPHGVRPTPYGQILLRRGGAAFDELRQGIKEIELLSDPSAGEMNLGCPESIATILPPVIEAFRHQCPRAVLGIDHEIFTTFAPRLRDRSLDLVLMRLRSRSLAEDNLSDDLNVEIVFDDELVLAVGRRSRLARRRQIDLAELVNEDWILPAPDSWAYTVVAEAFCARRLSMPRISLSSLSVHLQANLLANDQFVTAVSRSVLHFYSERFSLKQLPIKLPAPRWAVAFVTLKNRTLSPVVERFMGCVREFARSIGVRPGRKPRSATIVR
jgi:DNA-binding transcriptional LysR family regulator